MATLPQLKKKRTTTSRKISAIIRSMEHLFHNGSWKTTSFDVMCTLCNVQPEQRAFAYAAYQYLTSQFSEKKEDVVKNQPPDNFLDTVVDTIPKLTDSLFKEIKDHLLDKIRIMCENGEIKAVIRDAITTLEKFPDLFDIDDAIKDFVASRPDHGDRQDDMVFNAVKQLYCNSIEEEATRIVCNHLEEDIENPRVKVVFGLNM